MKLSFRQGIVRHQQDTLGTPTFLNVSGGYVSLIVSPDPTIVAFIHGQKDYLYSERQSVTNAWGPFSAGADQWLYWQLNPTTGLREFGSTSLEPIETASIPTSPSIGQMWFNTVSNTWYEWNGASWVEVIRVFACRLENGTTPRSMSINAPVFTGTQVGITQSKRVGALAFDTMGKPIRTGDNKFFTTEDAFVTGVPTGASLRVSNIVIPGVAQEPLSAYSVVQYYDFNKLEPADPLVSGFRLYGFIEEDAATGEVVNFVTEGMIVNSDWDWITAGADVNDPVYNDATGLLTLTPAIPDQLPIGVVTGPSEILFSPRLFPQVDLTVIPPVAFPELTDTPTDYVGAAGLYVRVAPGEDGLEFSNVEHPIEWGNISGILSAQTDLQLALDVKSDNGHTHLEADITDLGTYQPLDDDLTAIGAATPTAGDMLVYEGSPAMWVARPLVEADVTDLDKYTVAAVDGLLTLKANATHNHVKADITDFAHTHLEANITDLDKYTQLEVDNALALKANTGHTHVKADITDFAHNHVKADITDFSDGDYATAAQGTTADSAVQPGTAVFTAPPTLPTYTVTGSPVTLPSPATPGQLIYVSDATGASVTGSMCFSNGTAWIDVTTGIAVV